MADTPLRTDRQTGQVVDPDDINRIASRANLLGDRLDGLLLDSLLDVAVATPANGEVLTWDATQSRWISKAVPASQGGGSAVSSVAGRTGAVVLTKADVGLDQVTNTADSAKPISVAQQALFNLKADLINGKIPNGQIPAVAITEYLGVVSSNAAMLALTGQRGDFVSRSDATAMSDGQPATGDWILTADDPTSLANWHRLSSPSSVSGGVTSVNGKTGPGVTLLGSDIVPNGMVWQPNTDTARKNVPAGWLLVIYGGSTPPTWKNANDVWLATA